jgi:acetyl-CoA carboxylase alpha subunit
MTIRGRVASPPLPHVALGPPLKAVGDFFFGRILRLGEKAQRTRESNKAIAEARAAAFSRSPNTPSAQEYFGKLVLARRLVHFDTRLNRRPAIASIAKIDPASVLCN